MTKKIISVSTRNELIKEFIKKGFTEEEIREYFKRGYHIVSDNDYKKYDFKNKYDIVKNDKSLMVPSSCGSSTKSMQKRMRKLSH